MMIPAACLTILGFQDKLGSFLAVQKTPEAYVLEKAKNHRVVFLGEDHAVKQNLDFAARLIPLLADAGIRNFGMEFGAEEDQADLDALVTAPEYDEQRARAIMFHYNVGWAYQEYRDLYRAAWAWNHRRRTGSPPFRILNLSYVYKWSGYSGRFPASMERVFDRGPIEAFRRDIVQRQVLDKGGRIVILTGTPHSFTHFAAPTFDSNGPRYVAYDNRDFGNLVHQAAPKETFTILLHQPFWSADPPGMSVYPAGGSFDRAFSRAVGFDLMGTVAGEQPDRSWYSVGGRDLRMRDIADGYVILVPIKQQTGCTVDHQFVTEANIQEVQKNWPDPDWHAAPKTPDAYYEGVAAYVDLGKRYHSLPDKP